MLFYYLYFRNRHSNRRLFCQNSKILVMPIQHWHGVWPRRRPASESSVSRNRKMRSFKVVGWSGWSIIEEGLKKRKVRVEVSYMGNMEAFAFVSLPGWKGTSRARCLLRASLLAYQIRHCVTWKQFFFRFFLPSYRHVLFCYQLLAPDAGFSSGLGMSRRYTNIDSSCADRVLLRSLDLQSWGGETFRRHVGFRMTCKALNTENDPETWNRAEITQWYFIHVNLPAVEITCIQTSCFKCLQHRPFLHQAYVQLRPGPATRYELQLRYAHSFEVRNS